MTKEHTLHVTFGTSRGRDTYGYTVVTLREFGKVKARCNGGGYDMRGTVFADWLQAEYQDRLVTIKNRMEARYSKKGGYKNHKAKNSLYGGTWNKDAGNVSLDGGCGFRSIQLIAEAIGLNVRKIDAGKKTDIILVTDTQAGG